MCTVRKMGMILSQLYPDLLYSFCILCHDISGLDIQASNEDYLRDLKLNHKKKSKGMFGESQCDKARKGKKV